jgi:hypothetical protein
VFDAVAKNILAYLMQIGGFECAGRARSVLQSIWPSRTRFEAWLSFVSGQAPNPDLGKAAQTWQAILHSCKKRR